MVPWLAPPQRLQAARFLSVNIGPAGLWNSLESIAKWASQDYAVILLQDVKILATAQSKVNVDRIFQKYVSQYRAYYSLKTSWVWAKGIEGGRKVAVHMGIITLVHKHFGMVKVLFPPEPSAKPGTGPEKGPKQVDKITDARTARRFARWLGATWPSSPDHPRRLPSNPIPKDETVGHLLSLAITHPSCSKPFLVHNIYAPPAGTEWPLRQALFHTMSTMAPAASHWELAGGDFNASRHQRFGYMLRLISQLFRSHMA
jgi:hypothetical protein